MTHEQILERARTVPIEMKVLPLEDIKRRALAHYAKLNGRPADTTKSTAGIALNFVRHQLTNYDALMNLFSKDENAQFIVSDRVLQKIAATYRGPLGEAAMRLQQNRRSEPTIRVWKA